MGFAPEVAGLVLPTGAARTQVVAARRGPRAVHGEAPHFVPQELALVEFVQLLVGVGRRLDARLDKQAQGAHGIPAVGPEAGQVEQCGPVLTVGAYRGFQLGDRRLCFAGSVEQASVEPSPPDRTPLGRGGRRGKAGERLGSVTMPRDLVPERRRDRPIVEQVSQRLVVGRIGTRGLEGVDEPGEGVGLGGVEPVEDREAAPLLPGAKCIPVEPFRGDERVTNVQPSRCVEVGQWRDRCASERDGVGDQGFVDGTVAAGEHQAVRQWRGCGRAGVLVVADRPLEPEPERGGLGRRGRRRPVQQHPSQGTPRHLDPRPMPRQAVEPTLRPEQHVRVAAVQHPAVGLQHTLALPVLSDELDAALDQPPPQRRQVRVHADELVRPVVGIHPDGPCRPFEQRWQVGDALADLRERCVHLQEAVEIVASDGLLPGLAHADPKVGEAQCLAVERGDHLVPELAVPCAEHAADLAASGRGAGRTGRFNAAGSAPTHYLSEHPLRCSPVSATGSS